MSEPKGLYYNVNKRKKAGTSRSKNNPKAPSAADWKNAAKTAKVSEAIVDHAGTADSDHEVQMARADLYNIADKALKLHKILKNISEQEGLQGWQQAKITKAADYMDSVFSSLNYETMSTMSSVQTRPASNGSVGVASVAMSESEVADYKALLEKATTRAKKRVMEMSEDEANEAKWYSGPKPPPRKKPKPGAAPKKNRLKNIAGAAALAAAGLGAGATANDYVQNFGNNNTAQAAQTQQAADVGGAGLSGAKATSKYAPGSPAAKLADLPSDAALDAQAAQIEKDFAAKNAANSANATKISAAQRDAARLQDLQARQPAINQAFVDQGASKDSAAQGKVGNIPATALQRAALAKQFADIEKSKDAEVDNLIKQAKPMSKYTNDIANAIIAGADKTSAAMRGTSGSKKESTNYRIAENDDDDSSEVGRVATRQASSRGQAIAWKQDADARSASAVEKHPEFFTDEHLDRVDAIYDIIERVLTPSKIYVTHRFGGKEGPFTALAIYDPSWPRTLGVSKSARVREFYSPIEDLGGVYSKPLRSGAAGFIMHVIV